MKRNPSSDPGHVGEAIFGRAHFAAPSAQLRARLFACTPREIPRQVLKVIPPLRGTAAILHAGNFYH